MQISPVTLEGQHVRLEPLSTAHAEALIMAASDGELWNSTVTVVPDRATMAAYIEAALYGQSLGKELPFVIVSQDWYGCPARESSATCNVPWKYCRHYALLRHRYR